MKNKVLIQKLKLQFQILYFMAVRVDLLLLKVVKDFSLAPFERQKLVYTKEKLVDS